MDKFLLTFSLLVVLYSLSLSLSLSLSHPIIKNIILIK
jgi:hypothetical protein